MEEKVSWSQAACVERLEGNEGGSTIRQEKGNKATSNIS